MSFTIPGREILGFLIARAVPVLGVLFLGWDARLVLFVISCEVIASSAVLAWLVDYPNRSTARGIMFVVMLAPMGLLLWLALSRADPVTGVLALAGSSLRRTWTAVLPIIWHALLAGRDHMAMARASGASVRTNDRLLIRWLFHICGPVLVFTAVLVWFRELGAAALAAVLVGKTIVELAFARLDRRHEPPAGARP